MSPLLLLSTMNYPMFQHVRIHTYNISKKNIFNISVTFFVFQELALKLVMAQAELHNIEKDLLKRIIGHLLENVTVKVMLTRDRIVQADT